MVTFSSNPASWLVFFILIAGAPVFGGIVNKLKAWLAGRFGASVLQPCFDLARLAQKETVYSSSSGFIARLAPVVVWSTTAFAMMLIPLRPLPAPISFDGDFILLAYLSYAGHDL
jgi:formate hydrogenlyase subunit 4